jgi:hypothetical protein
MENGRHPKPTTSSHSRPQKEALEPNTKKDKKKDQRKRKRKENKRDPYRTNYLSPGNTRWSIDSR